MSACINFTGVVYAFKKGGKNMLWNLINNMNFSTEGKVRLFLFLSTFMSGIIGFGVWFIIHFFALNKISWALCFITIPGILVGYIGGIVYLLRRGR